MKFEGTINIQTPREEVWEFLTDPHAVSACAPGLESLKIVEPDKKFQAMTRLSLGTVKVRFTLDIDWVELNRPDDARMKARGTTPASDSSTDITSRLVLTDGPNNSTNVGWDAEVAVVGKIASLAARLMNVVTRQLTDEFFACVKGKIEKGEGAAEPAVEKQEVEQATAAAQETGGAKTETPEKAPAEAAPASLPKADKDETDEKTTASEKVSESGKDDDKPQKSKVVI